MNALGCLKIADSFCLKIFWKKYDFFLSVQPYKNKLNVKTQ